MATAIKTINYSASKAAHHIVVKVTGLKLFNVRLRVAAKIFYLAAWVAGTQLLIETSTDD